MITGSRLHLDTPAITVLMVFLDLLAFASGLVFGRLMERFRTAIKYYPPLALMVGYALYACADGMGQILIGSAFIGTANGVGVPYLLTIASIKGGKNSATPVMPLLSAALYLGQFLSPLVVLPLASALWGAADVTAPYKVSVLLALVFLFQVWAMRRFQSLPPQNAPG